MSECVAIDRLTHARALRLHPHRRQPRRFLRLAGEAIHEGLIAGDLSPERFTSYGAYMRQGVENMRKLVYAFYDPKFSFREVIKRYPDAAGQITDCLSADVNKDFSQLWSWIRKFVPLSDDLPYGEPLLDTATVAVWSTTGIH